MLLAIGFCFPVEKCESSSYLHTYLVEVRIMRKYTIFAEMETLLLTVVKLPGASIKGITETTDIKANTLYYFLFRQYIY